MKTKELIKQLNEIDPDGEMEVCVGNRDIYGNLYALPSYYDGRLQRVSKRSENGFPLETTIETGGSKIVIDTVDLFDTYTDSIIEDGEEYPIKTNGGIPHGYSWLDAQWTASKVDWLIWAEKYITKDLTSNEFVDDAEEKLKLINELKEKYKKQTVDALKSYARDNFNKKQRESAIKLIDRFTEKKPIILDIFRGADNYTSITGASWMKHEFKINEDGSVKYKEHRQEEWQPIDLEEFDFDAIFEDFDKSQDKKFY